MPATKVLPQPVKAVQHALLRTLIYADLFEYPLTQPELWRYFIGKKTRVSTFNHELFVLVKSGSISKYEALYTLPKKKLLIQQRQIRETVAHKKIVFAQKIAQLISLFPWVWYVGISGALAMHNAPEDDDIDFFIITAPGRLWITRFLCVLLLDLLGVRRRPKSYSIKNKICLNMFVDASHLQLPKNEQDLYSAHEVVQLKTLQNKHSTYERFLSANRWIGEYLPHAVTHKIPKVVFFSSNQFISLIEVVCKRLQLEYMKKRRTREVIKPYLVRFHPKDMRSAFLPKYKENLASLGIKQSWVKML